MDIVSLSFDTEQGFTLNTHWIIVVIFIFAIIILSALKKCFLNKNYSQFEIDEATIGIGNQTVKIKPNDQDIQIAYQLWVELSTRKIGLPIDKEHDVIIEIYNSWYEFFKISRDLIKSVPVKKIRANASTKELINITFKILNCSLRPHLTKWQARYRRWHELKRDNQLDLTPQEFQRTYPEFSSLIDDMIAVNDTLIKYKKLLNDLIDIG